MKKKVYTFGLLVFLSFIELQAQTPYFYYYKGEKQYMEISPNRILVQFAEGMNISAMKAAIAQNTSFSVSDITKTDYNGLYLIRFLDKDTTDTKALVNQWKNGDTILYSYPVFINEYGEEVSALTNQIIVRLKQQNDYSVLQESLELYDIYNLRQDEFDGNITPNDLYFPYQWGLQNTGQYDGTAEVDIKDCDEMEFNHKIQFVF
jgi:hypothetical protein